MTYTVGQQILDGRAVVASVDASDLILSVTFTSLKDMFDQPLTVTYSAAVTEQFLRDNFGLPSE